MTCKKYADTEHIETEIEKGIRDTIEAIVCLGVDPEDVSRRNGFLIVNSRVVTVDYEQNIAPQSRSDIQERIDDNTAKLIEGC